jgi:hypothetical protein
MIIQLPPGSTSVVLRFDGPGHTGDVTLVPGLALLPPPPPPSLRQAEPRRMAVVACAALGTLAVMAGLSVWNGTPRAEAILNPPRAARWNGDASRVPAALQAELDRTPTVIPPDAAPPAMAPPAANPAAKCPAGTNPFGLE